MNQLRNRRTNMILGVLLLGLAASFIGQLFYVIQFNQQVYSVQGKAESEPSYMDIANRGDSTSTWLKRDYDLYGETVTLKAETVDGTLYNHSEGTISTWEMTIRITGDCFINNAWCGVMEIHQFVGTDREKVQTLDLRNYSLEEVKLEYLYDGDLLIPLQKGDYLHYYPSEKDGELPVQPNSELTMGMIFYYLDELDISDYTLDFRYYMGFSEGPGFYLCVLFAILSLTVFVGKYMADNAVKRAIRENELKQSGIASMSDIYSIIYYLDLETDELIPVSADERSESRRPKELGARQQLLRMTAEDAEETYLGITQEFIDISTLPERMGEKSIACEYISKEYGWTRLRFFPAEREEGAPLKKVIFAIQDINEEKRALENSETRVREAEKEQQERNLYVTGILNRVRKWLEVIGRLEREIRELEPEEKLRVKAAQIGMIERLLSLSIDAGTDASNLATGYLEHSEEEYSPRELLEEFFGIGELLTEGSSVSVKTDVSKEVPKRLKGDVQRIRYVLMQLVSNAVHYTKEGTIKLSVFGKVHEEKYHLLFSVKDTGGGVPEKHIRELESFSEKLVKHGPSGQVSRGHGLEVAASILAFLDSGLKVINKPGEGAEFYFELEQDIVSQGDELC